MVVEEKWEETQMTQAVRRPPLHHTLSLVLRFSFVLRLALGLALDFELELRFVLRFVLDLVKELLFVWYVLDTLCVRLCVRATLSVRVCVRLSVRVTLCVRRMGLIMEEKQTKERKKTSCSAVPGQPFVTPWSFLFRNPAHAHPRAQSL